MMSLTVLVGTLSLLPSSSLSLPASLHLSICVVTVRGAGSGRKEKSLSRKKKKEEEEEDEETEHLYTNQDPPEYFHSILSFTAAGTLSFQGGFGTGIYSYAERGSRNSLLAAKNKAED